MIYNTRMLKGPGNVLVQQNIVAQQLLFLLTVEQNTESMRQFAERCQMISHTGNRKVFTESVHTNVMEVYRASD